MTLGIPSGSRQAGFSLIEVAMAIGIFSFCLISIMGLIPVTLQTSRDSMNKGIEVRMLQSVRAGLMNAPYSTLPAEGTFLFDADGGELTPGSMAEVRYRVAYTNCDITALPGAQNAGKLTTTLLVISNVATAAIQTNCLHLPDNGF